MHAHARKQEMNYNGNQKRPQPTINLTKEILSFSETQTVRYHQELLMYNNFHYF